MLIDLMLITKKVQENDLRVPIHSPSKQLWQSLNHSVQWLTRAGLFYSILMRAKKALWFEVKKI